MREKIYRYFSNLTLRTKYILVFLGAATVSYLLIILVIGIQVIRYENRRIESSLALVMEQAVSFIESETANARYASDVLYRNSILYDVLENSFLEKETDPGEEYRKWYQLSQTLSNLKTENIFSIRIYAPDNYTYTEQNQEFAKLSTIMSEPVWEEMEKYGETPVWVPKRMIEVGGEVREVHSLLRRIVFRNEYSRTVGVVEVSIESKTLYEILENSNIAEEGCVFLLNKNMESIGDSFHVDQNVVEWDALARVLRKQTADVTWKREKIDGGRYILLTRSIPGPEWKIAAVIPLSELGRQVWRILGILIVLILPIMLVSAIVIYSFANRFSKGISTLAGEMQKVCDGNLTSNLSWDSKDELGRLYQVYRYMLEQVNRLLEKQYEDGKAIKNAELKALQAQINPHFLYNTLELIYWESMENDAIEISDQVQTLAKYYRAVLSGGADFVSIRQEIDQVQMYIQIQNYRFDGRIDYQYQIPEEYASARIMKLIMQPLVENAILHGFASNDITQRLLIRTRIFQRGETLVLTVEDNGSGMSEEQCREILKNEEQAYRAHYAVSNIDRRMKLNYGMEYGLKYDSKIGKGTTVFITIPYQK